MRQRGRVTYRTLQLQFTLDDAQLAALAVLGRTFSYELLQAVTPLDEASLQQALARLVEAELLYQRGVPPQATYLFKHALIQDAAYQSLLKSTRQQVHQRIAQVVETRFPASVETQPELVAQHYSVAGCTEQAIPYWQRAGQQASDRSANVEAISHFTTRVELLKTLPETPARTPYALTLYIALGAASLMTKGHAAPEVEHAYMQARTLCQWARHHSLSLSCMGCIGIMLHGHSCTRRENSGIRYCAWRNVPTTPCSRSLPTMPLGRHGCCLACSLLPASTWRKASYVTRQASTSRLCLTWVTIQVLPADSGPL